MTWDLSLATMARVMANHLAGALALRIASGVRGVCLARTEGILANHGRFWKS
jgi:hypothetical protein